MGIGDIKPRPEAECCFCAVWARRPFSIILCQHHKCAAGLSDVPFGEGMFFVGLSSGLWAPVFKKKKKKWPNDCFCPARRCESPRISVFRWDQHRRVPVRTDRDSSISNLPQFDERWWRACQNQTMTTGKQGVLFTKSGHSRGGTRTRAAWKNSEF